MKKKKKKKKKQEENEMCRSNLWEFRKQGGIRTWLLGGGGI